MCFLFFIHFCSLLFACFQNIHNAYSKIIMIWLMEKRLSNWKEECSKELLWKCRGENEEKYIERGIEKESLKIIVFV